MDWQPFITNNKELFDFAFSVAGLLSAILLGAMAVVLAWQANRIANAQTELLKRQTALTEEQAQPKFRVQLKTFNSVVHEDFDCVEIWNGGAALSNYSVRQYCFYEISRFGSQGREIRLYPGHYLFNRSFTGETTGLLVTLCALKTRPPFPDNRNTSSALRELGDALRGHWPSATIQPKIFLNIFYEDLLGKSHEVMYLVRGDEALQSPGFGQRLRAEEARRIIALFGVIGDDLAKLSAEEVIEQWEKRPPVDPAEWTY